MRSRIISVLAVLLCTLCAWAAKTNARAELGPPDMAAIQKKSTDPDDKMYYPRLLARFQANDTTMTPVEFQYFYFGTLFQEDYDPYREAPNQTFLQELAPIYAKSNRTRAERNKMLDYAIQVLADNPIDLRQLTNRIYVYQQNGKYDLAKIWQYKLNHLLLVIAASGTGTDPDNAWIIVFPQHEYEFLNLSGFTASSQRFEPPHYDYIEAARNNGADAGGYYFNIAEMLRQYFIKHPSELSSSAQ